jgi:hypothetical protein
MLTLRVIMNSACEAVFGFKTCCGLKAADQNLEVQVVNRGDRPVIVPSFFDLETDEGVKRYEHLLPHGRHELQPGEIKAFYCYMDPVEWARARRLAMVDGDGRVYSVDLPNGE